MTNAENLYAVLLHGNRIGSLAQRGDHTRFSFSEGYLSDPMRPVLGLRFEENLRRPYMSALRLPRWFSNLLPEGPLREWIAEARQVSLEREMELLAQVGHDLPGAVQVLPTDGDTEVWHWEGEDFGRIVEPSGEKAQSPWRFSLAGVALKLSMLAQGDRLTIPAGGDRGDWLVKFPDYRHPNATVNEFAMMSLAGKVGIDVPDVLLMHRDELRGVPDTMWPNRETWAYAVRRFDRAGGGTGQSIHIEDFAQVRDKYPNSKYEGSFETVAAISYRGRDLASLREAVRRISFNILMGNGDAHLKNWSLIYPDARVPKLSPAYDLVSTAIYAPPSEPEDLGLKLQGSRRFENVSPATFAALEARLDRRLGTSSAGLGDVAATLARSVEEHWPECREILKEAPRELLAIDTWVGAAQRRFLRKS